MNCTDETFRLMNRKGCDRATRVFHIVFSNAEGAHHRKHTGSTKHKVMLRDVLANLLRFCGCDSLAVEPPFSTNMVIVLGQTPNNPTTSDEQGDITAALRAAVAVVLSTAPSQKPDAAAEAVPDEQQHRSATGPKKPLVAVAPDELHRASPRSSMQSAIRSRKELLQLIQEAAAAKSSKLAGVPVSQAQHVPSTLSTDAGHSCMSSMPIGLPLGPRPPSPLWISASPPNAPVGPTVRAAVRQSWPKHTDTTGMTGANEVPPLHTSQPEWATSLKVPETPAVQSIISGRAMFEACRALFDADRAGRPPPPPPSEGATQSASDDAAVGLEENAEATAAAVAPEASPGVAESAHQDLWLGLRQECTAESGSKKLYRRSSSVQPPPPHARSSRANPVFALRAWLYQRETVLVDQTDDQNAFVVVTSSPGSPMRQMEIDFSDPVVRMEIQLRV